MGILDIILCTVVVLYTLWICLHAIVLLRLLYLYEKCNYKEELF